MARTKALLRPGTEGWPLVMLSRALCILGVKDELPLAYSYYESVSSSRASFGGEGGRALVL